MAAIKVWQKNQQPEEGFFFHDGELWQLKRLNLDTLTGAAPLAAFGTPAAQKTTAPPPPESQQYIGSDWSSYFDTDEIEIFQRHIEKNGRKLDFLAALSKHGKRVDIQMKPDAINFDPMGSERYKVKVKGYKIQKKNGYVEIELEADLM